MRLKMVKNAADIARLVEAARYLLQASRLKSKGAFVKRIARMTEREFFGFRCAILDAHELLDAVAELPAVLDVTTDPPA